MSKGARIYPGRIAGDGVRPPRPCHIVDVSGMGARLRADDPAQLPDDFTLLLSADGKVQRRCKVIWRSNDELAVRFVPGPPPAMRSSRAGRPA